MEPEWRDPNDLVSSGEVVVRLNNDMTRHSRGDLAFWLGKSVHQIAYVTSEGDVTAHGRVISREMINGWMPLPERARLSQ